MENSWLRIFWLKNFFTVFFQINALGVYQIFTILGGVYWRGTLIREAHLFKRNRILTMVSFHFSMFLNYNSISGCLADPENHENPE